MFAVRFEGAVMAEYTAHPVDLAKASPASVVVVVWPSGCAKMIPEGNEHAAPWPERREVPQTTHSPTCDCRAMQEILTTSFGLRENKVRIQVYGHTFTSLPVECEYSAPD